jgi:hypothetical protein
VGQQQLLLIILAIIIVGIAIAISIQLFRGHAVSSKRDLLVNECNTLGSIAIGYYKRARSFGGGGNTFIGWDIPKEMKNTTTGNYTADVQTDRVIIKGVGTEVVTGSDSIEVQSTVLSNSVNTEIIR